MFFQLKLSRSFSHINKKSVISLFVSRVVFFKKKMMNNNNNNDNVVMRINPFKIEYLLNNWRFFIGLNISIHIFLFVIIMISSLAIERGSQPVWKKPETFIVIFAILAIFKSWWAFWFYINERYMPQVSVLINSIASFLLYGEFINGILMLIVISLAYANVSYERFYEFLFICNNCSIPLYVVYILYFSATFLFARH